MSRLALEIPLAHWDDFIEYSDFDYALAHEVINSKEYTKRYREQSDAGREVWLDNSYNELKRSVEINLLLKAMEIIQPTHLFTLERFYPRENIKAIEDTLEVLLKRGIDIKTIGCWRGGFKELDEISKLVNIVALPYDEPRELIVRERDSKLYHYLGLRSLSELLTSPPRSIDTSLPIRGAVRGYEIDLCQSRPANLGYYDPNLKLTREQLKLAKRNCEKLKEALIGKVSKSE
ncbi:MAG: hypothetical protein DDT19_01266 [Syntrophomonadaceae bacterium]|nr:hypothetical protein [Bacillota bacterium]